MSEPERRSFGPIYRHLSRCGTDLSQPAKGVLFTLLERLGANAMTWPTQHTLAIDTGMGERTVRRALRELEALGFVATRQRGLRQSNEYTVDVEAVEAWALTGISCRSGTGTANAAGQERPTWPVTAANAAGQERPTWPTEDPPREGPPVEDPPREAAGAVENPRTDTDEAIGRLCRQWEHACGTPATPLMAEKMADRLETMPEEWIAAAIEETGLSAKSKTWNHTAAVLDRYTVEGGPGRRAKKGSALAKYGGETLDADAMDAARHANDPIAAGLRKTRAATPFSPTFAQLEKHR